MTCHPDKAAPAAEEGSAVALRLSTPLNARHKSAGGRPSFSASRGGAMSSQLTELFNAGDPAQNHSGAPGGGAKRAIGQR